MTESRKEIYEQLLMLGLTPQEAWEQIANYEFTEDYNEREEN